MYPTFEALAQAPVEEVEQLWRPLGYNFRPTRLHAIARCVIKEYDGKLPDSLDALQSLCGIGRYTAGAILNFAFHKDAPILDTNVRRVLQRFFAVPGDPHRTPAHKQLWHLAERVIPPGKGYIFNQAILDFGALLCTARKPSCPTCPLNDDCSFPDTQSKE
jgi:A/G-specific adenine glycosylase